MTKRQEKLIGIPYWKIRAFTGKFTTLRLFRRYWKRIRPFKMGRGWNLWSRLRETMGWTILRTRFLLGRWGMVILTKKKKICPKKKSTSTTPRPKKLGPLPSSKKEAFNA